MASGKPGKYNSRKTTAYGLTFDSKREFYRYRELLIRESAGEISGLKHHPRFKLSCGGNPVLLRSGRYRNGRVAVYEADAEYIVVATGERIVEDTKGFNTPLSALKRAVLEAETGIRVLIVK